MNVNEHAPVVAASEAEVAAEPETLWDILTAFERWPTWNPDVKDVSMSGRVAEGSEFRWRAGPSADRCGKPCRSRSTRDFDT